MDAPEPPSELLARVAHRWRQPERGEDYRDRRWRRRRQRDPELVAALLARYASGARRVLDVPAGTGRLAGAAPGSTWFGVDASQSMLRALPVNLAPRAVVGLAEALPLRDGAVDVVLCCRLLHHLPSRDARRILLAEFARVTRDLVIVSFWDRTSWPQLRRRLWGGRAESRVGVARAELLADLRAAGLEPLAFSASARFLSAQTFAVARRRDSRPC